MNNSIIFDYDAAMDRVDNDLELYFELIEMLFEDNENALSRIENAIESKDYSGVEAESHALKSALGNLGAMEAYALSFELEKSGRAQELSAAADTLDALRTSIEKFRVAVEEKRP